MSRGLLLPRQSMSGPFSGDKILWHCDALQALRSGGIPAPITVELDLTNVCNLKCPYCTNSVYNAMGVRAVLESDVVQGCLRQFSELGTRAVTFTGGGEPLCHPDFEELFRAAKSTEPSLDVALITNGILLHRVDLEELVRRTKWIRISVDAWDAPSYISSKGSDKFDLVMSNISRLVDARRTAQPDCTIGIGFLTEKENVRYAPLVASIFRDSGVDYLQFRPMTFMPTDERRETYDTKVDISILKASQIFSTDTYKVLMSVPKYEDILDPSHRDYSFCSGVYFSCVVGATGDVWICCHFRGYPKYSLGNVNERSFHDIWLDVDSRNPIYSKIDFRECMPLCRFHGQNKLLARFNWYPQHVNFL